MSFLRRMQSRITHGMKHKQTRNRVLIGAALVILAVLVFRNPAPTEVQEEGARVTPVTVLNPTEVQEKIESIEASGVVSSVESVDLSSEVSARVVRVGTTLGSDVRAGDVLVSFANGELQASYAGAQADVDSARANKKNIEAQLVSQQAVLERVRASGANTILSAESALRIAENNLRQSTSMNDTLVVRDAYANMVSFLLRTQSIFQSALTSVDNIIGVDNTFANDGFEDVLSAGDYNALVAAERTYETVKQNKAGVDVLYAGLQTTSDVAQIDSAVTKTDALITEYRALIDAVTAALNATAPVGNLSQAQLDGLKQQIQLTRSSIAGVGSELSSLKQAIASAKNSFDSLEAGFKKAQGDLDVAKKTATADEAAAAAQLVQVQASLDLQDAQIRSAQARAAAIGANLAKTTITAPISGTIAAFEATVGELVSPGQLVVRIVNTGAYEVKTYIAAEDVSSIAKGNAATIADQYQGIVMNVSPGIDPTTNKVEVIVLITSESVSLVSEQFVPVRIERSVQGENEFVRIPLESVRLTSGGATVLIVNENNMLEERTISIGQVVGSDIEAKLDGIDRPFVVSVRGLEPGVAVSITE